MPLHRGGCMLEARRVWIPGAFGTSRAVRPCPWWVEAQSRPRALPFGSRPGLIPRALRTTSPSCGSLRAGGGSWTSSGTWTPRCLDVFFKAKEISRQVGDDLKAQELCFVEKLWSDRIRVFKAKVRSAEMCREAGAAGPAGEVPLSRAPGWKGQA